MNFTLEDSTTDEVSPLLAEIINKILSQSKSVDSLQKDFLFVLIIVLMIENGFIPLNSELILIENVNSIDHGHLMKWKTPGGIMETYFVLKGFESISLKLIMSPLGATAIVNLIISDLNSETYSVCLPMSRYVVSPQASTIPMIFRDLKHFSNTLKNNALCAVKSRILSHYGYSSASLLGLPNEVLQAVLLNLSTVDIVNISKTCKSMHFLLSNQILWRELYKRDFKNENLFGITDFKEMYKQKYLALLDSDRWQSRQTAGSMHDYMDYSDFVSYIDNPLWDIII